MLGYIADVASTSIRPSKRSSIAAVALVVWVLVLVFGWALRPIEDTVPVVVDPTSELAVVLAENPSLTPADAERGQLVQCNTLFDSEPRDLVRTPPHVAPGLRVRTGAVRRTARRRSTRRVSSTPSP